ncbi:MaoC family dehydratase [Nocardia sp. NPDC050799]|uniref:MaoC family dehydratase n=1 Tax=Nocardia sp. NPDC050799 TaxID=3154842 RepID=UPI0033FDB6CD
MTRDDRILRWELAEVDGQRMKTLALLLADANPIHLSGAAARDLGFPDGPVNQGPSTIALIYNLFEQHTPHERVRRLTVRLLGTVIAGEAIVAEARKTPETSDPAEPGDRVYDVTVEAGGVPVIRGRAVTAPRREERT